MSNLAIKRDNSKQEVKQFVITAMVGSQALKQTEPLWSHVWNPKNPLTLGYPFRWIIEGTEKGIRVRRMSPKLNEIIDHPVQEFTFADLKNPIELDSGDSNRSHSKLWLRLNAVVDMGEIVKQGPSAWHPNPIPDQWADKGDEKAFKKSSMGVAGAFIVSFITILLMPAKKIDTELVPEQFAKVIMNSAVKAEKKIDARSAAEKKNENNVVKAFKSEAVQKTTKALFSAGAAKALLSQSKLMDVAGSKMALKQVFGTKSGLIGAIKTPDGNQVDLTGAKIGMLGGSGKGKGNFGYGTGAGGAVNGQGTGTVAFNTEGLDVNEGLTKDEVGQVIRKHLSEIRYCYESAMVRNPGLEGKFVVSFTINNAGFVKSSSTKESSGDTGLDNCILTRLAKWAFPKPRGGADVGVSYPFIFKSLSN
jgi:TonB family protein